MTDERKAEVLEKALDWITESASSRSDLYSTLSEVLELSDDEIVELGFVALGEFMEDRKTPRMGGM